MTHKQIARLIYEKHGQPGWWSQMVTVGYEQALGLREVHETSSGYSISRSKTINVSIVKLFHSFNDAVARRRWLSDSSFTVRKATKNKSMRITWVDGKTSLEVGFFSKGAGKSQVAVQHSKLKNAQEATRQKAYWEKQLGKLKTLLEV